MGGLLGLLRPHPNPTLKIEFADKLEGTQSLNPCRIAVKGGREGQAGKGRGTPYLQADHLLSPQTDICHMLCSIAKTHSDILKGFISTATRGSTEPHMNFQQMLFKIHKSSIGQQNVQFQNEIMSATGRQTFFFDFRRGMHNAATKLSVTITGTTVTSA